jgi:hypothetical protein
MMKTADPMGLYILFWAAPNDDDDDDIIQPIHYSLLILNDALPLHHQ